MHQPNQADREAQAYLNEFHEILNTMIHGMTNAGLNQSISHNFIRQIIPHHRAAIEMSRDLLQYSEFEPLREIALNIIEEQTESIADMEKALPTCTLLKNTGRELQAYQQHFRRIVNTMFIKMRRAPVSNNINVMFMREMIPHHLGAIRMSENALRFPICAELLPILHSIIVSQENGVREMEALLREFENQKQ